MQQQNINEEKFKQIVGEIFSELRKSNSKDSLNNFARAYGFDRGNLSKIERGQICCQLITAWKLAEALNIKFSDFAKRLEDKLGENFKLIDE